MKKYLFLILLGFYNSTCFSQIYGVGNGDGHAITCIDWDFGAVVLPANLFSFDAFCSDDKTILQWSTPSDFNNNYFTIERSTDAINFQSLSNIYIKETYNGKHYFSFTDETAGTGKTYYRLKQTGANGQIEYSRVVSAGCNTVDKPGIRVYPNPTSGLINIMNIRPNTLLILRNSLGQPLLRSQAKPSVTTINLGQFPTGIYYIEIHTLNKSTYHKIVLNGN